MMSRVNDTCPPNVVLFFGGIPLTPSAVCHHISPFGLKSDPSGAVVSSAVEEGVNCGL
jgi:hypothetical protein